MPSNIRIPGELLQGLETSDNAKREERVNFLLSNSKGLELFKDLLDNRIKALEKEVYNKKNYENPSWAYFQADINGQLRQLTELSSLLQFTKDS